MWSRTRANAARELHFMPGTGRISVRAGLREAWALAARFQDGSRRFARPGSGSRTERGRMPYDRSLAASLLVTLMLLSGCASEPSTFQQLGQSANTKGFGEKYPPDESEDAFTFGVGDTVGVLVQNTPDLSGSFVIRIDGKITMNVIGDVQI